MNASLLTVGIALVVAAGSSSRLQGQGIPEPGLVLFGSIYNTITRAVPRRIGRWFLVILVGTLAAAPRRSEAQSVQEQSFRLDAGWNLIAFQVLPSNLSPAAIFGSLGNAFERVWSYNNQTKEWTTFARPGTDQGAHNQAIPLEPIQLGRAYWVYANQAVPSWTVTGSAPTRAPAVVLGNGWNLIGVPTGRSPLPEPVSMLSVLTAAGLDYDVILRWEAAQYRSFTPDDKDVDDFTQFDANRGH